MSTIAAFFEKLGPDILARTHEHLFLTFFAMLIATAIALPLGIFLARCRANAVVGAVMGCAAVVQTVPSLALIAFIVLLFALMHFQTIGMAPALTALVLYALLPILRNTYTGIRQVDPAAIEVAAGLGMKPRQILFSVELPLSLPVIMAGIRIATVWTIGIATLCTLIGAGGLGDLIMRGLRSIQMDYLIAGTVPAAMLAVLLDVALARLERWLTPKGLRDHAEHGRAKERPGTPGPAISLRNRVAMLLCGLMVVAGLLLSFCPTYGIRVAFDAEFHTRPDGYKGLCRHYGFQFPEEPRQMDPGLMYRVLSDGAVDVIDAFATDGRIEAYDLLVLEDDKGYFPPYYAAPLVRKSTLLRHPELGGVLDRLGGAIPDETMRRLNYEVDGKGKKAFDVAREFLVSEGLLHPDAKPSDGLAGSITIGGKQFTEQEILAEMMAVLIECQTQLAVVRRLNLGGTMICFQALQAGDLDLYAEYTGTGLVNILKREVISDPDESFRVVKSSFDQEYGLVWLSPFGFDNTYTLCMRRRHARELGIGTISDLADRLRSR